MELGITSIYVTHDQVEAMTMADRIAVMKEGHLQAYCTPDELYDQPQTLFIAGFVGNPPMNFLDVEVTQSDGAFRAVGAGMDAAVDAARAEKAAGRGRVVLGIRPEDVRLSREAQPDASPGEVYIVEPLGRDDLVMVKLPEGEIHALTEPSDDFRLGETVYVRVDPARVQFFDPATELSLIWR
jgi:ABC-type sugar transport system ATPase subunit